MGSILFLFFFMMEAGFMVYCLAKHSRGFLENRIMWLFQALTAGICFLCSYHSTVFQWMPIFLYMAVLVIAGTVSLIRKSWNRKEYPFRKRKVIGRGILHTVLWFLACIPLVLFPPYKPIEPSGSDTVQEKTYTWTDKSRVETLDDSGDFRNVTVTMYYPEEQTEKCPLVIYSHGAFGISRSNYSSYADLVSNGYVVCSISHTGHAFYTQEADGTVKTVNTGFMKEAVDATHGKIREEELYQMEQKWMEVRIGDADFVLDRIEQKCKEGDDPVFKRIDLEHIGMYGHSMGGATSVEMARRHPEIDAVVVLDGTFLGDYTGYEDGNAQFEQEVLQTPILNMQAADNYKENKAAGDAYVNNYTLKHALIAADTVIEGTKHMNYTDLPLFSPIFAGMLGTGEADSRECIGLVNKLTREWFDCYLKGAEKPEILPCFVL